jgi:asparagine synthase (glutamine-hydrolysing)
MCGIVFVLNKKGQAVNKEILKASLQTLHHRGPDEQSTLTFDNYGIGFNRLSIVDVAGGHQPFYNNDKSVLLICNGEIYNHQTLRDRLNNHHFKTHSDCEVILHLYEENKASFIEELNGMFAFILIDTKAKKAFVGRDRLGIKPLFVYDSPDHLIISSEAKGIFGTGLVDPSINKQSVYDFFMFSYIPGRSTLFQNISNFPSASIMHIDLKQGTHTLSEYWSPEFPSFENKIYAAGPFADTLETTFTHAVSSHTLGDLPVGSYLSGGVDSTVTTLVLNEILQNNLKTFSIKFSDSNFDESSVFMKTVEMFGLDSETIEVSNIDAQLFQKVLYHLELPQRSLMDIHMFTLSKLVKDKGYKVVLSGEGSDELFGGYHPYKMNHIRRSLSAFNFWGIKKIFMWFILRTIKEETNRENFKKMMSIDPNPVIDKLGTYPVWYPLWQINGAFREGLFQDTYADSLGEGSAMFEVCQSLKTKYADIDDFNKSIYIDMKTRLPNYILARADKNSMAHSVELRVPYLSNEMIDYGCSVPPMLKMFGLKEKYILNKAFEKIVPQHVLQREKFSYNAPTSDLWQGKDDLRDELMSPAALTKTGIFNAKTVNNLLQEAKETQVLQRRNDLQSLLTGVLSIQLLHQSYVEAKPNSNRGATGDAEKAQSFLR